MRVTYVDEHIAFGNKVPNGNIITSFTSSILGAPQKPISDAYVILEFLGDFESFDDALKVRIEGFESPLIMSKAEYEADKASFDIPQAIWASIVADGVIDIEYVMGTDTQEGTSHHGVEEYVRLIFSWDTYSNSAPHFRGASTFYIEENSTFAGSVMAADADGDGLTYAVAGGADGSLFTIDRRTGELSFKSAPDYENPSSASGTNTYQVRVRVSDGVDSTSRLFSIEVLDVPGDEPPVIISGSVGDDRFRAKFENAFFDGGDGHDTVIYPGSRGDFTVTLNDNGFIRVTDGTYAQLLLSIERIEFSDGALLFDIASDDAPAIYRLYQGAFDRAPDKEGLLYWIGAMNEGRQLADIADYFLNSPEFVGHSGALPTDAAFIDALYLNILDRAGDAGGTEFWNAYLSDGGSRTDTLIFFTQLPEYVEISAGHIDNGYWVI